MTDLGTIGGTTSIARGLSAGGFPMIAGYGTTASGQEHAFVGNAWRLTDIGTLGGPRSEARATEVGRVVGLAQLPNGAYHAFLHHIATQGLIDLGTLGGSESYATAINESAVVVGASRTAGDSSTRAFVYENGVMSPLGATLGGPNTVATGINNPGHIVGYADLPGAQSHHAFLFANGVTTDLGSLGGSSEAYAINDSGVIVGRSHLASGANQHAFRYQNGVLQDLGTLGGASSEAIDVSNDGVVVGWADTAQGERRAFIWRDGVMTDLNTLIPSGTGWVLQAATGIDNGTATRPGAIVGYGVLQGRLRAFLLTPPIDLRASVRGHENQLDTNIPNPHEAGQVLDWGVTVRHDVPYTATGVSVTHTIGGPVEYLGSWGDIVGCARDGQRITCQLSPIDLHFGKSSFIRVRATAAGTITHSATVTGDQPDPDLSNNSDSESNTAVSLASLTLTPTTITGGQSSVGRATLTSRTPSAGVRVTLTSSHPDIASVPSEFHVLPFSGDGLYREFYVTTKAVSAPVTVQISATCGLVTRTVPLTIMPPGSQWPFGDSPRVIPGMIQAEDFDEGGEGAAYHDAGRGNDGNAYRSTDVDVEPTSDAGGGWNVGWTSAGEWLEYTVNVATAGTYTLEARVASPGAGGTFHVEMDGINKTGTIPVPDTAGWQSWTTVSRSVTLEAGVHILRVSFDSNGVTGAFGNLNYLRFVGATGSPPEPTPPRPVPGTVQAEDFDEGGEGVGYHDSTAENSGGQYRATGVDIERTTDTGGGYNVGWMTAGEWLKYTVSVSQAGAYTLTARVAANGVGGTFHVEVGGIDKTGPLTIPNTGGWQAWTDVTSTLTLGAGTQTIRFVAERNGPTGVFGNLNYVRFVSAPGVNPPAAAVPGTVQAEDFDEGGDGVGYHDSTAENSGGQYRATGVDIERTTDTGGGYNVGWMTAGEWLKYTASVSQAGTYTLTARVSASGAGGTFHIEFGGIDKTGPLTIPNTGGWQAWTDLTTTVTLATGTQTIRFVADRNGPTGVFGNLNYLKLALASTVPSDIVLYATDLMLHGAWARVSDSSAAAGQKALTPDAGWSTASAPLANPVDYFEATFDAPAGTPYTLWLRLRATGDTKASESVWVQYSDARANGTSVFPIGSTAALLVNLEACRDCGVSGWGWKDGAYWLSQPSTVSFASSGSHTIRIQVREDGTQIDQIVLSPSRYLNTPPGPVKNDATIVPK